MKIHYVTIATKPHPVLNNLQQKIDTNNEKLYILGQEEDRHIGWQANGNFGLKIKLVQDFLKKEEVDDNDILLFTDAYDVIYGGNFDSIIERYFMFDKPVIFGAETTCSPDPTMQSHYEYTNTTFPYLNSGLYIGKVNIIRKLINSYEYNDKHDDQLYWTYTFLKNKHLIQLDYTNELFLNTYGIDIEDITVSKQGIYYNGKNPLFLHVNGPDKSELERFL